MLDINNKLTEDETVEVEYEITNEGSKTKIWKTKKLI
jgi:hypothetical protein